MNDYVGRFAPSPTGPLHLGSLYTAVASFIDAKAHQGRWLLRIEDLDPPREKPGATAQIIHSLKAHALHWDDDIICQSLRHHAYAEAVSDLQQQKLAYFCECSRQQLQGFGDSYPGFCRHKTWHSNKPCAIRLIADAPAPVFTDRLLGRQKAAELKAGLHNDFVIFRKDGFYAYQLAVVVDDIAQGITHIVRGSDILDSTFKQAYLYRYWGKTPPQYLHLPIIIDEHGQKLSKQNLAPAIDDATPCDNLLRVLDLLGQSLPPATQRQSPQAILEWAIRHWNISNISKTLAISS